MNARIVSTMTVVALTAAPALVASAGGAGATPPPRVTGGGSGPVDSDRVQVQLTARGTDGTANRRFNIVHHTPDGFSPTSPATLTASPAPGRPRS